MNKKTNLKENLFFILMIIFICLLIFVIVLFINNKELIIKDPLNYGMKLHNFESCSCFDNQGKLWVSNDNGFQTQSLIK